MPPSPTDEDWESLIPRLLLWATRLQARVLSDVRGAPTAEDLVQDAVTDVLTGRRNRPTDVPLAVLLYGVIRSRVSQVLARSKAHSEAAGPRFVGLDAARQYHAESVSDPAQAALLRSRVLRLVEGDDVLSRMVELWFEDPALTSRDLAEMIGVPVAEIYAATRRLRRREVDRAALSEAAPVNQEGAGD